MDGMKRALDTRKVDMRALKVASSTILTLAIMVAIFSFSAQSGGESGSLSDAVARMLASAFVGGFDAMPSEQQAQLIAQMSWPIRKTAHASEYAFFIDGRAGQVADVLVDASGAAIGCLLTCILIWRFMTRRMRRREL